MAADPDQEMNALQEQIRLLKRDYELYYSGQNQFAPLEARRKVEASLRTLRNTGFTKTIHAFRFNTVMGTFTAARETWDKLDKYRERGMPGDPRSVKARQAFDKELHDLDRNERARVKEERTAIKEQARTAGAPGPAARKSGVGDGLFQSFVTAKLAAGQMTAMSEADFAAYLAKQRKAVQEKYQVEDVDFQVTVADGKVLLQAKPIRKKP